MNDKDDFLHDEAVEDFETLLHCAVRIILNHENPAHFLRWFGESAPLLAPDFFAPYSSDPAALRGLLVVLGREIWNKTPLLGNHFRPHTLPKPERNAPCPCGSGRKYKQCCAIAEASGSAFPNLSMLEYVLDALSASQIASLPYPYLNPEELAFVAEQWMEKGRVKDAVKLLAGLFADFSKLDERAEHAFDILLDCYDRLNNPLKKKRLLAQGFNAPNKQLRAAAMQRQCCILSDRNEYAEAWKLFQELQRMIPNDPTLSHLEITMLLGEGEKQRAAERAKFWLARLARDENAHEPLMDFLRLVARGDAAGAMLDVAKEASPALERLIEMIRHLPKPTCHYTLKPTGDNAGPLMPDAKLRALYEQWDERGMDALDIGDDLGWLEKNPFALQSFDILDDWLGALEDCYATHGFEEVVLIPLLKHAEAVLRTVIERHHASKLKLEWGWQENRPALGLLEKLAMLLRLNHNFAESVSVMEWMVLTLNPNDNQGMREFLIHDYLRLGRVADAISLVERYPDDMASMTYGAALALFIDKQDAAATTAIKVARKRYPEGCKMLLADKPKQPQLHDEYVTVGGKDEAWLYRNEHLDIWQSSGGLEWLRQLFGKAKNHEHGATVHRNHR
jgi:tetratricopeptide (TPR) repeat protein